MHELAICRGIITQVTAIAAEHNAQHVDRIYLKIGPLSGVEPDLLRSAFPIASARSVASDAALVIQSLPIRVHCKSCHAESEVAINKIICGHCGDWQTELVSGDELLLERVELEIH